MGLCLLMSMPLTILLMDRLWHLYFPRRDSLESSDKHDDEAPNVGAHSKADGESGVCEQADRALIEAEMV
ncbi:hypothetical protein V6N12_046057 [Hibiscus sabdariffa]|uniref:Uncharacterized protein n=1 Tax=Hibiscus sabdariffa TaxID=183260 RepID=A0ABR2G4I4_9ROSI